MNQKLKDVYSHAEYEIQIKAPILRAIIYVFFVASAALMIVNILKSRVPQAVFMAVLFAIMVFNLYSLMRGKYSRAAILTVYSFILVLVLVIHSTGYTGDRSFPNASISGCLMIFVSLIFSPRKKHLYIHIGIALVNFIVFILISILSGAISRGSNSVSDQIMIAVVGLVSTSILGIFLRSLIDRVISDARYKLTESLLQTQQLSTLADQASKKLSMAQSMKDQAVLTDQAVQKIIVNIEEIANNVKTLVQKFNYSIESLDQIETKMEHLDSLAESQSSNITETSAAIEEMVASINNVSSVIETKMTSVENLKTTSESGNGIITATSASFDQVIEHLDSIKQVIKLISAIAGQTNLLAMNAAIEAAHAGDSGKGFAVVASEVRKLAESSSQNAKQIQNTLNKLVKAIIDTGENVKMSGNSFLTIAGEVEMVRQAMQEINISIKELASGSSEIIKASSDMRDLTGKVVTDVQETREHEQGTQLNVKSLGTFIQSLPESMEKMRYDTENIRRASRELIEKSDDINEFVKEFSMRIKIN
ncbi:MAG: hypothetical protein JW874_02770 [Spirochaetales bacterium]|nr:hypothetical protein [Spirochaetales bacterium]